MTLEIQDVLTKPDAPELRSGVSLAAPLGLASFSRVWETPSADTYGVPYKEAKDR